MQKVSKKRWQVLKSGLGLLLTLVLVFTSIPSESVLAAIGDDLVLEQIEENNDFTNMIVVTDVKAEIETENEVALQSGEVTHEVTFRFTDGGIGTWGPATVVGMPPWVYFIWDILWDQSSKSAKIYCSRYLAW